MKSKGHLSYEKKYDLWQKEEEERKALCQKHGLPFSPSSPPLTDDESDMRGLAIVGGALLLRFLTW